MQVLRDPEVLDHCINTSAVYGKDVGINRGCGPRFSRINLDVDGH